MKNTHTFALAALLIGAVAGGAAADTAKLSATAPFPLNPTDAFGDSAEVGTSGADSDQTFLNVEGPGGGEKYASFGVIDFNGGGSPVFADANNNPLFENSISPEITLTLGDSPYYAAPGTLDFYLSEDNTDPLSGLTYETNTTNGVGNQLGPLTLLGTGAYTSKSVGNVPDGKVYTYNLTLPDATSQNYTLQQLNDGGNIRLVVAADPTTPNVAGTFFGAGGDTTPTLTVTAEVPEAGTPVLLMLGLLGGVGLGVARRRAA